MVRVGGSRTKRRRKKEKRRERERESKAKHTEHISYPHTESIP